MEKKVGKVALKLHTCRSRNDQVVFGTKSYAMEGMNNTLKLLANFMKKVAYTTKTYKDSYIPGYTHLQHAMPVSLGTYFGAHLEAFMRDFKRLQNANSNIELTLGAGALAGTIINSSNYNIPPSNSIDAVSDRDFVIEILSALAITGMHLSRLAEDLILWSTKEFDFIDIDEAFCTGSSLMPQKKNPDVLELIRGNTGKLYGNLMGVLVMMKGLPLSYNRDMQLDKEPLFNSFEIIQSELEVLAELLPKITFNEKSIKKQLDDECLYATDMADYLVQNKVAFKDAHTIIGRLIGYKLKNKKNILDMKDVELKKFHPLLNHKLMKRLINPETSVRSKKSIKRR